MAAQAAKAYLELCVFRGASTALGVETSGCDREMRQRYCGDVEAFRTTKTNWTLSPNFGRKSLEFILLLLSEGLFSFGYSQDLFIFFKIIWCQEPWGLRITWVLEEPKCIDIASPVSCLLGTPLQPQPMGPVRNLWFLSSQLPCAWENISLQLFYFKISQVKTTETWVCSSNQEEKKIRENNIWGEEKKELTFSSRLNNAFECFILL